MEVFVFIVLIVLITQFFDYRKSMAKLNAKVSEVNDGQMQKELENVKQRLIVLERIVTDKNYDLNEEFGKIRGE
jgi:predicted Holliday junction resolvase-like endonuclease